MKRDAIRAFFSRLRDANPEPTTELEFGSPYQLLVAVVLSAQATDRSVNIATRKLFALAPTPEAMITLGEEGVAECIKTIGLYRNKAKNAVAAARRIVEVYGGEVPRTVEELVTLPGVGRKTANVVVSNAFGVPAIAVDTHVGRLARRLGFSKHDDPDKVEADLQKLFDPADWVFLHHGLILHGRRVCAARKPDCGGCGLAPVCPSRQA